MNELFGEKIVHRMMSFSDPCDNRFGFRPKHSCANALIEITEKLRKKYAKKETAQACFVDVRKTFDKKNHEKLLEKFELNGFRGK